MRIVGSTVEDLRCREKEAIEESDCSAQDAILQRSRLVVHREPITSGYDRVMEFLSDDSVSPQSFPEITLPVHVLFRAEDW